jgi:hypothetical protein
MHALQLRLLRALAAGPRGPKSFCDNPNFASMSLTRTVAATHLDALVSAGHLHKERTRYFITPHGSFFLNQLPQAALPGAPVKREESAQNDHAAPYTPPPMRATRPGADDFLTVPSLGWGKHAD